MKLLLLLAAFLISLDLGITKWRSSVPISTAPVWSLPMMDEAMANPGEFQRAIDIYNADRGGELQLDGPDQTKLTVFYFEWDQIETGPFMDIERHEPEVCNSTAGFTLVSHNPSKAFETPDNSSWVFDATTFSDPGGRIVYIYKASWIHGIGSWDIRQDAHRLTRLKKSFTRVRGAARVLQCAVTGSNDEFQAWQIFQSQVLKNLAWEN